MSIPFRDDVCLVIDMDGLHLQTPRKFQCRELGYCSWSGDAGRVAFHPLKPFFALDRDERRTWRKVHRDIHGLPYHPVPDREEVHVSPHAFVWQLYCDFATPHRPRVAYKGGTIEKKLLDALHLPSLNLETLGCPKYDRMVFDPTQFPPPCGLHTRPTHHCALWEAYAFMCWYRQHAAKH